MLSRFAAGVERVLGPSLANLAGMLEVAAAILLAAALALCIVRGALALRAWRHGWETRLVVRCRRCGRLAADPETPVCPAGHPVRFPASATRFEALRRRFGRWRRAAQTYPIVLSLGFAGLSLAGYVRLRVGRLDSPLAAIAASLAFVFCLAFLYAASQVVSPEADGWTARLFHGGIAVLLLLPVLLLGALARSFEPPERKVLGHLWSTPTAVYLSTGGRARRVAPAASLVEAHLVEARAPAVGLLWEGLKTFRVGEIDVPWKGKGGATARWLDRWVGNDSSPGALAREVRRVDVPANVRILIVKEGGEMEFTAER